MPWQVNVLLFTVLSATADCKVSTESGDFRLTRDGVRNILRSESLASTRVVQHVGNFDRQYQTVAYALSAGQRHDLSHARADSVVAANGGTTFIRIKDRSLGSRQAASPVEYPTGNWTTINIDGSCEDALFLYTSKTKETLYLNPVQDDDSCNRWNIRTLEGCQVCCEKDKRCTSIDWYHGSMTCNLYALSCDYANTTNTHHSPSSYRLDRCLERVKAFGLTFEANGGSIWKIDVGTMANVDNVIKNIFPACHDVTWFLFVRSKGMDAASLHISKNCKPVTTLSFPYSDIGSVGIKHIAKGCPNLRTLHLSQTKVQDEGFFALAKNCQFLTTLYCGSCKVSNTGWGRILRRCPKVKDIKYTANGKVTKSYMNAITKRNGVKVTKR